MARLPALLAAMFLIAGPSLAQGCGSDGRPCRIASGEYHLALPDGWTGGPGVMHLHGFGGSGRKVIRNAGFVTQFTSRGYAVIAPTALPYREGKPNDWSVRDGDTYPRDDFDFLRNELDDAVARAGVDRGRVLLTGFSRGGSLVWDMACISPGFARAYAPVAGGFWLPMTEDCAGPVWMLHTHGFADRVVPLEGRGFYVEEVGAVFTQADVWAGLRLWRRENGCIDAPSALEIAEGLWRRRWSCEDGGLELVLHEGGHGAPPGWAGIALDWFERLER